MKECKKCEAIMPDDSKDNVCGECKQKRKKIIKVVVPMMAVASTVVTHTILKGKIGRIPANSISDVTNNVVSGLANNSEKVFGGLTQSTLDGLAKATSRGVKAVIQGDTLQFVYKSASGKTTNSALFKFDDAGKLLAYLGNGSYYAAKEPRFFCEEMLKIMRELN